MSVKYFCDGCRVETGDDRGFESEKTVYEKLPQIGSALKWCGYVRLCAECESRMRVATDPSKLRETLK